MLGIIKKEVKSYFFSPVGYVFIGTFLIMSSVFFYLYTFSNSSVEYSGLFIYTSELLTFTIPLLTMGMFASERRNGTETLLLTSSRSLTSIVIGKFIAAMIVIIIAEIISLMYYVILCIFAGEITNVGPTIAVIIGIMLLTMSYISFGGFLSSLTENTIIAGIATIVLLLSTWFIPNIASVFRILSPIRLFENFTGGVISVSDSITLVTQCLLFTSLTVLVLQRRKNVK